MRKERLYHSVRLASIRSYKKKHDYIVEHRLFDAFGKNSFYGPFLLPVYPELIRIHDNVFIHKTARLVPHDMINRFLKTARSDMDFGHSERLGCIEIMDNVYISMNAIVLPGVRINRNCIVTAGSVVTGDIPENSVVSGNPARVIGRFDQFVAMRSMMKADNKPFVNQVLPPELASAKWERFDKEHSGIEAQAGDTRRGHQSMEADGEAIRQRVIQTVSSIVNGIDIQNETHLIDHHILDSLGMMTLVAAIEDEFDCTIPFSEINAANFNSADMMAKLVASLSESAGTGDGSAAKDGERIALKPLELDIADTEKPVVQRIMAFASKTPEAAAIIANDHVTTYSELACMIYSISNWMNRLADAGGRAVKVGGNCVVVQAVHEDTCVASYYAVHLNGGKLVPVEKTATPERIMEIARETGAVLIIAREGNGNADIPWVDYDTVRSVAHRDTFTGDTPIRYPDIDLPCEMVFTTGTTGKSKGVLMTHRHISWYSYAVAKCVEMKAGNRFLLTTPLNHAGGLRRTHLSLANGCCMVYMDGLSDLNRYFDTIQKYRVTSLYLPPVAVRILLTRTGRELEKYRDQIDFVYSSSSSLPDGDCRELRGLLPNTRLYNAYEASETPGVSAYDYNTDDVLKNCLGKANEGVELAIMLEDGKIVKTANVQGQICVKSRMNMSGYYREPELTASVVRDGWFVSNDLGYLDEAGNVYYMGRKGDVINIGGYKIAPTDVEEVALASGLVNECVCIEAFDEYRVPYIELLVVVDSPERFDAKPLISHIASKLEAYKVPRRVECVSEIRKTFNGKIDRKAYRGSEL